MNRVTLAGICVGVLLLGGCTTTERYVGGGAGIGGLGGAAIGAGLSGTAEGALIGGAIGAGAGALVGAAVAPPEYPYRADPRVDRYDPGVASYPSAPANYDGQCVYRDAYGQRYLAACPRGGRYGY